MFRGTAWLIRPFAPRSGVCEISRHQLPVACLARTLRDSGTLGVEQKSLTEIPDTANLTSSAALVRSHAATSWQPAAVAMLCILAITGCGRAMIDCMSELDRLNKSRKVCVVVSCSHLLQAVPEARRLAGAGDYHHANVVTFGAARKKFGQVAKRFVGE